MKDELLSKYKNLRKNTDKGVIWNIDNLRDGFQLFYDINHRYPRRIEIDNFEYLPSVKTIERSFGGLVKIRKDLNLEGPLDFTKGEARSAIAKEAFKRSQDYEKDFYFELIKRIPEIRVHEHKIIRPGDTASDFYIYTNKDTGIFIDLFYARDVHSLSGIIRIKSIKCTNVKVPIFFILIGNDEINQKMLDQLKINKKTELQDNINIVTLDKFVKEILPKIVLEPINC